MCHLVIQDEVAQQHIVTAIVLELQRIYSIMASS